MGERTLDEVFRHLKKPKFLQEQHLGAGLLGFTVLPTLLELGKVGNTNF